MRTSGLVSVVIPSHNRASTLRLAVDSALAQSGVEVEVLVCDDGSTDDSESVVRAIADERVRWLPGPASGGPSAPRNRGLDAATGDWVAFLDSDDVWLPHKLTTQLALMGRTGCTASSTNAERMPGSRTGVSLRLHTALPPFVDVRTMLRRNLVVTSGVVLARCLLDRVGRFRTVDQHVVFEDYAFWLRIAHCTPIAVVDEPLVRYRDEPATSYRGSLASELVCTSNALCDYARWRSAQDPPAPFSWAERRVAVQQLASLLAVRDLAPRAMRRLTGGAG